MKKVNRTSLIVFPILVLIGYLVALAGSQGGATLGGVPVFMLVVGLAFLIQWLVFIPSFLFQTEKFFDLTGSITYISVTVIALVSSAGADSRAILLAALVIVWAIRLGTFLFTRIRQAGKDDRFDEIKPDFFRFPMPTLPTRASSSARDCGRARVIPITSARSCCGSESQSSPSPCCKAGSGWQ